MDTYKSAVRARQGVPPDRKCDVGPIPEPMLGDLRRVLWRMEKLSLYSAIGMGMMIGAALIAGITLFTAAGMHDKRHDLDAIGGLALAVLAAMAYSPFFNRWFEDKLEAKWLREALYSRRLEDLAHYMAICQMGSRRRIAVQLLVLWTKYRLEPGWSARPMDPAPLFK